MALIERKKCELFHIDDRKNDNNNTKQGEEKQTYHNLYTVRWKSGISVWSSGHFLILDLSVSDEGYKNKDHCSFAFSTRPGI